MMPFGVSLKCSRMSATSFASVTPAAVVPPVFTQMLSGSG